MIRGTVNADLEAVVRLTLCGLAGTRRTVDAIIDTGFQGFLTLPSEIVVMLGFPPLQRTTAVLADGSTCIMQLYAGAVVWNGVERRIAVGAVDAPPLVGMALLRGYRLSVDVVDGGGATIIPINGGD